jgi:hypothetical protein
MRTRRRQGRRHGCPYRGPGRVIRRTWPGGRVKHGEGPLGGLRHHVR